MAIKIGGLPYLKRKSLLVRNAKELIDEFPLQICEFYFRFKHPCPEKKTYANCFYIRDDDFVPLLELAQKRISEKLEKNEVSIVDIGVFLRLMINLQRKFHVETKIYKQIRKSTKPKFTDDMFCNYCCVGKKKKNECCLRKLLRETRELDVKIHSKRCAPDVREQFMVSAYPFFKHFCKKKRKRQQHGSPAWLNKVSKMRDLITGGYEFSTDEA